MRKCLAVIFLIIFSFQVLPLKVLGKLMAKAQTEEEVKQGSDDGADDLEGSKISNYNDLIFHAPQIFSVTSITESSKLLIVHRSAVLPLSHITEIPSPPPNR